MARRYKYFQRDMAKVTDSLEKIKESISLNKLKIIG